MKQSELIQLNALLKKFKNHNKDDDVKKLIEVMQNVVKENIKQQKRED